MGLWHIPLCGMLICGTPGVTAETARTCYLFVVDASGSMDQPMMDSKRMVIAKRVLMNAAAELPQGAFSGLIVFGNKIKGCENYRLLVSPQTDGASKVRQAVNSLKSSGTTPLAATIRFAGQALKKAGLIKAVMILVTDGEEECRGNPLAAARDLLHQGIDVKLHVIGFAATKRVQKQLSEIAKEGGGTFHRANTAQELEQALAQAMDIVKVIHSGRSTLLSAPWGKVAMSRVLYRLREGDVLSVRFKPTRRHVRAASSMTHKATQGLSFRIGGAEAKLVQDLSVKGWKLLQTKEGKPMPKVEPRRLSVIKEGWNTAKIVVKKYASQLLINDEFVCSLSAGEGAEFRVTVEGFEVEFRDLTISLPFE